MSFQFFFRDGIPENIFKKASLDLNFAKTKTLLGAKGENLVTFSRASSGTYFDANGVLQVATSNVPRFDHDPTTGESLGLLLEEQRTNLALNSADVSQWQAINSAVVAINQVTAPDGTLSADGVTAAATNSNVTQQVTITSSTNTYTVSCFIRNNNAARSRIDGYIRVGLVINVSGGVIVDWNALTATGTGAAANVRLTPYLNGWYRLSYSIADNNAASDNLRIQFFPDFITGNKQIYLWGLQCEIGAFPTSYIPTTGSTATRNADVVSITGTNFSNWYNQAESTLFGEGQLVGGAPSTFPRMVTLTSANPNDDEISLAWTANTSLLRGAVTSGGVPTADLPAGPNKSAGSKFRCVISVSSASAQFASDGVLALEDTTITLPTCSQLLIAQPARYQGPANTTIKRICYWPRRLTDATLQKVTR